MRILKKILLSTISTITIMQAIAPGITASANELNQNQPVISDNTQELHETINLDEKIIEKADPYITVENGKFVLNQEANEILTETEIDIVENSISENNKSVFELKSDPKLTVSTKGNKFEASPKNIQEPGTIGTMAVQYQAGGITFVATWWGMQIQFTHNAVEDFTKYFGLGSIGYGASETALKNWFIKKGFSTAITKWMGPLALFGDALAWSMGVKDKGNGVNVNCILYVPATVTTR